MVYRRRSRKTAKRRTYRKRPRSTRMPLKRSRNMLVNTSRSIIANRYKTKLIYSDFFSATTVAGNILWHQFYMNGLWKPDHTNVGHQPRGYDQLMQLYQTYTVTGCKIIVEGRFTNTNIATTPITGNIILGYLLPNGGTLPTDMVDVNEARQFISVTRADTSAFRVSKYFDVARSVGQSRNRILAETQYSGNIISNAPYAPLVNLGFVEMNSSVPIAVKYSVTMVYYVQFGAPFNVGRS